MAERPIKLNKEQQQLLYDAEQRLVAAAPLLDKIEACGGNCQGHRVDHAELVRRIQAIRQHFMEH